jgi:hypothetical protein
MAVVAAGTAQGPEPRDHHRGFNRALEDAVRDYAEKFGRTDSPVPLTVTFGVLVTVTNPGRIEGYTAQLGNPDS